METKKYEKVDLVVVLWENPGWTGHHVALTRDTPDLAELGFSDKASAIGIHPGPNFQSGKEYCVSFYDAPNYAGSQLVLKPGAYGSLARPYNFDNRIRSVRFDGIPKTTQISPIPVVAELFQYKNFKGHMIVVMGDVEDLNVAGPGFSDKISSVIVYQGPNYRQGATLRLFVNTKYQPYPPALVLEPGEYPEIASDNMISSAQVS